MPQPLIIHHKSAIKVTMQTAKQVPSSSNPKQLKTYTHTDPAQKIKTSQTGKIKINKQKYKQTAIGSDEQEKGNRVQCRIMQIVVK